MNYVMLVSSITLAVVGQLLMKQGMRLIGYFPVSQLLPRLFSIVFSPYVFVGFCLFGLSAVLWLVVLSRFDLSVAYPMVSMGYVFVALVSVWLFNEPVSWVRWLGVLTIVAGVVLISRS